MTTLTPQRQAVVDRVERELLSGYKFTLIERSNRSVPLGGAPIASRDWAGIMQAIARYATGGNRNAATAAKLFGRINLYLTPNEVIAQVAGVLAEVVREGYYDVWRATGPEPGRPSSHQHATDLREAINLALLMVEVEMSAGYIGHVPGVGWALQELLDREGITPSATLFPKVAQAARG